MKSDVSFGFVTVSPTFISLRLTLSDLLSGRIIKEIFVPEKCFPKVFFPPDKDDVVAQTEAYAAKNSGS